MKKLLTLILLLPLLTVAQEKVSLLFESNINYAPLGLKLIIVDDTTKIGGYITVKISEDYFLRDVYNSGKPVTFNDNDLNVDINELIIGVGMVFNISKGIDFYFGSGVMAGTRYVLGTYRSNVGTVKNPVYVLKNESQWEKTNSSVLIPMASFGVIMAYERVKFTFGNETAFTNKNNYPVYYLNSKSFGRLSSFTFGMGYTF